MIANLAELAVASNGHGPFCAETVLMPLEFQKK